MSRSLLETDAYKLAMAEAGFPLRRETFVYMHRTGGPFVVPFDVAAALKTLLPGADADDQAYLDRHGYRLGDATRAALSAGVESLEIAAAPAGSWLLPGEPIATLTGPSALVSWLEPLVLQWSYRIQVATLACSDPTRLAAAVTEVPCEEDAALVADAVRAVSGRVPAMRVDANGYRARVHDAARALVAATADASRVFEVGLRAATSRSAHLLALGAMAEAGVVRTSHVFGARALGLIAVGTMGHEHVQRFGNDDAAFRAMRDRRAGRVSYLVDTFDAMGLGLPAAYRLIASEPARDDAVRFDSGDKIATLEAAVHRARALGITPTLVFEDGLDAEETRALEAARARLDWPADRVLYGFGSALVAAPRGPSLGRDAVGAVYKLCETDRVATMKLVGPEPSGKRSLPGRPVVFRRVAGDGPLGLVGQAGEPPPPGMVQLTGADAGTTERARSVARAARPDTRAVPSVATQALIDALVAQRVMMMSHRAEVTS